MSRLAFTILALASRRELKNTPDSAATIPAIVGIVAIDINIATPTCRSWGWLCLFIGDRWHRWQVPRGCLDHRLLIEFISKVNGLLEMLSVNQFIRLLCKVGAYDTLLNQ